MSNQQSKCGRLHGLAPGHLNISVGPDFQGAEFELDGCRIRGDVELHRAVCDWYRHGHHLDWRYDSVVLHLVAEKPQADDDQVKTSKGLCIPTFVMDFLPDQQIFTDREKHCQSTIELIDFYQQRLKQLAGFRLQEKIKNFHRLTLGEGMDQALYRMIMRIIGMPQNSDNFEYLAHILPWSVIQIVKKRYHLDREGWYNLFLTISGLQQSPKNLPRLSGLTDQQPMMAKVWHRSGFRPAASPVRRLQGLADFIAAFPATNLLEYSWSLAARRHSYESLHEDFYRLFHPREHIPGWGAGLITEVTGNAVIPALYHQAELTSSEGFRNYLDNYYYWLPLSSWYGCLKAYRQWPQVRALPAKYYIVQGFLWLQRNYCRNGICHDCPLGHSIETV